MFDLTSGKLLLLGIVALIVLGPKDFPILLRTIGKYMGIIKRQADEFRAQFDEAIRESEFDQIKKDVEGLGQELNQSVQETQKSIAGDLDSLTKDIDGIKSDIDAQLNDPLKPSPHTDGYTPAALRDASESASPAPGGEITTQASDPEAHDANGMPMDRPAEAVIKASPEGATSDRSGLNGSGGRTEHSSGGDSASKSGA